VPAECPPAGHGGCAVVVPRRLRQQHPHGSRNGARPRGAAFRALVTESATEFNWFSWSHDDTR
jgi:hypothetical protein